jgi:hypothetical protein
MARFSIKDLLFRHRHHEKQSGGLTPPCRAPSNLKEFVKLLTDSSLVDQATVEQHLKNSGHELNDQADDQIALFSEYLIAKGVLTKWQSEKLRAGKWKGFYFIGYIVLELVEKTPTRSRYLAKERDTKRKVIIAIVPPTREPLVQGEINAMVESFVNEP